MELAGAMGGRFQGRSAVLPDIAEPASFGRQQTFMTG
jgi:hypothetical protein